MMKKKQHRHYMLTLSKAAAASASSSFTGDLGVDGDADATGPASGGDGDSGGGGGNGGASTVAKKLGFAAVDPTTQDATVRKDPYLNELLLERYHLTKRLDCALCQFPFLNYNLPFRVSFKCIVDLYAKYVAAPGSQGPP